MRVYKKWTPEEEAALQSGVTKYGFGKWSQILKDPEFGAVLSQRTNVNLKDKWRTLYPIPGKLKPLQIEMTKDSSTGEKLMPNETPGDCSTNEKNLLKTRLIWFQDNMTRVILQKQQGPCSLIAICNALLLKNTIKLSKDQTAVSQDELIGMVRKELTRSISEKYDDVYRTTNKEKIEELIGSVAKFAKDLDVNITFTSITGFERDDPIEIFSLLDIQLCHGYVVDPQDLETAAAIGGKTYDKLNEVVAESMVQSQSGRVVSEEENEEENKGSTSTSEVHVIKKFLLNNLSQLTVYGLSCLHNEVNEGEVCVFFRNNHMNTMVKFDGGIYLLATDEGFIFYPDRVWEKLCEVNGNTKYVDAYFEESDTCPIPAGFLLFRVQHNAMSAVVEIKDTMAELQVLVKAVGEEFSLDPNTFFLEYLNQGEFVCLRTEAAMNICKRVMKERGMAIIKVVETPNEKKQLV